MPRRIKIIANPISGTGRAGRLAHAVQRELQRRGYQVDLAETRKQGDARELAGQVEGYDRLICVGGDGTVSEVVNGLPLAGAPPLATVPSGTGNAYAKELRLPWTVSGLAEIIDAGTPVDWDVGYCPTLSRRFVMFAGSGFHSEVVRRFQMHRTGPVLPSDYVRWVFDAAFTYDVPRVAVEIDGKIVARDSSWVDVFNISHYGGPLRLAAHASPSDGLFDVLVFRGRNKRDLWRLLLWAYMSFTVRKPFRYDKIQFFQGRRVRLFSDEPVPVHMDGDYCGYLPVDLEVMAEKVKLLAPAPGLDGSSWPGRAAEAGGRLWAMLRLLLWGYDRGRPVK